MNVLANDGISKEGIDRLNSAGFKTIVESIDQSAQIAVAIIGVCDLISLEQLLEDNKG